MSKYLQPGENQFLAAMYTKMYTYGTLAKDAHPQELAVHNPHYEAICIM